MLGPVQDYATRPGAFGVAGVSRFAIFELLLSRIYSLIASGCHLTVLNQLATCSGVRNWDNGWRLSLGLAAVPGLILLLGAIILPESPNFLVEK